MQRKGIFPTFQLIFCAEASSGCEGATFGIPKLCLTCSEFSGFVCTRNWWNTEICCVTGMKHILLYHFPDATEWLLSRPTFSFSPFVCWSGLIFPQLCSPQKLWTGTTRLNVQRGCAIFVRWGLGRRVSVCSGCSISSLVYRFLVLCICVPGITTRGKRKPRACMDVCVWRERRGCWQRAKYFLVFIPYFIA